MQTITLTKAVSINAIMAYQHAGMIERLQDKLKLSVSEATLLFDDVKRFLYLCSTTEGHLAPTKHIDEGWHHFILHTKDYALFCERFFGRMVHHTPFTREQRKVSDGSGLTRAIAEAERVFGDLSPNWSFHSNSECRESCENGCHRHPTG